LAAEVRGMIGYGIETNPGTRSGVERGPHLPLRHSNVSRPPTPTPHPAVIVL